MRHLAVALLAVTAVAAQTPSPYFESIQPDLFALGTSFTNAWADYDNDNDPDLFVGFGGTPNRLYRNDNGTFADVAAEAGVADARATRAVAWGDYDADGDPDLLVGFTPGNASLLKLYRNDGGRFVDVTAEAGLTVTTGAVRQPSWIDIDADGDLDLFVAFRDRANALYRNTNATFADVAPAIGLADTRKSVGAVWFDADADNDLDLVVANMDGDANAFFRNDGGKFTDVAEAAGIAWGGRAAKDPANGTVRVCAADVNADGLLDLFFANYGPNGLFLNRGAAGLQTGRMFEDVSKAWGIAIEGRYDTCAFADYDNDGRIDVYVNGTVTGGTSYPDYLLGNTGSRFEDVTPANLKALNADHGAAWADTTLNGRLDLALTGSGRDGMHTLLRNRTPPGAVVGVIAVARAVEVRVLDGRGRAVMAGAEVRVFASGSPRRLIGMGLVDTGSGYDSQGDLPVHIGAGTAERVDVEVTFPAAGTRRMSSLRAVQLNGPRTGLAVRIGMAR